MNCIIIFSFFYIYIFVPTNYTVFRVHLSQLRHKPVCMKAAIFLKDSCGSEENSFLLLTFVYFTSFNAFLGFDELIFTYRMQLLKPLTFFLCYKSRSEWTESMMDLRFLERVISVIHFNFLCWLVIILHFLIRLWVHCSVG